MQSNRLSTYILITFLIITSGTLRSLNAQTVPLIKTESVLYPRHLVDTAIANAEKYDWAKSAQQSIVEKARRWYESSDDDLWAMMFSPTITRSWMVWSDGYCPVSKKPVRMYDWQTDPWEYPWKVRSPHTGDLFPKNDFKAYYDSGLDEHGVFNPEKADRSLLYNTEHPDADDPLRNFCVEDGEGYLEGDKRWRFIGYYLKAGQWKQLVLGGIDALSNAYLVTGDPHYAQKAAILLDRVADLYPLFDHKTQAEVYETKGHRGFVSTWHDACEEVREMALAYDRIFDAISKDAEIVEFLSRKAEEYKLDNPKDSFKKIQANIEDRIFRETLRREEEIRSNYPRTPIAVTVMKTVLEWPSNRDEILSLISEILNTSIKEDGLTGEEGLTGYTTIFPSSMAPFIMQFESVDPTLLRDLYARFPDLYLTYRFHIDTWCLDRFYPRIGDCGKVGEPITSYMGVITNTPDMHQFLWRMYELSGDPDFVKVMVRNNNNNIQGLGQSIFSGEHEIFQKEVQSVLERFGTEIHLGDVNKEAWGLSILRSGEGEHRRAVWLDHDSDRRHSHRDALNIGLYAKGLDLLPDYGYPPVGYGGWGSPKSQWYTMSAAHNTVVVDGEDSRRGYGQTTLWGSGEQFHVTRVDAPDVNNDNRFERTIALIDISPESSYVFDLFYVVGGKDHAKFQGASFGHAKTRGLTLIPAEDYGHNTQMRNFQTDPNPAPGWSVDWHIEDRYNLLPKETNVHLRYTDLTYGAQASVAEAWVAAGLFGGEEEYLQRAMIRRTKEDAPLASCFAAIIEPYENQPAIAEIVRIPMAANENSIISDGDGVVTLKIDTEKTHVIGFKQTQEETLEEPTMALRTDSEFCFLSINQNKIERIVLCHGSYLRCGNTIVRLKHTQQFIEIAINEDSAQVVAGDARMVDSVQIEGKRLVVR
ncbi:MAG: heparinase II/III family protein [bacterium]